MLAIKKTIQIVLFIFSSFILGFYTNKFLLSKETSKNNIILKENIKFNITKQITMKLPSFIEKDLNKFNITEKKLMEDSWNKFLNLYLKRNTSYSKNNYDKESTLPFISWKSIFSTDKIDLSKIESLIKQGYNINKKDKNNMYPIAYYIESMNTFNSNTLDKLINLGVDFKFTNTDIFMTQDVITSALMNRNQEVSYKIIEYLESKNIVMNNENVISRLMIIAVTKSKYETEYYDKILPFINISINVLPNINISDIVIASANNESINILLNQKVEINKNKDINILHFASKNENISMHNYQRLIDLGVNINMQKKETLETPLMLAVKNDRINQVKILIKNGADISLRNNKDEDIFNFIENIKDIKKQNELLKIINKL